MSFTFQEVIAINAALKNLSFYLVSVAEQVGVSTCIVW